MLAGTSDMTWYTPNNRIRVTCDTTVEITETEAYLISFTLDGWAMIWRMRTRRAADPTTRYVRRVGGRRAQSREPRRRTLHAAVGIGTAQP